MKNSDSQVNANERELFFSIFRKNIKNRVNCDNEWKIAVRNEWQFYDLTKKVWDKPFASELEKHIAIQASSLLIGEIDYLTRWPIKPWRDATNVDYSIKSNRFPPHHQAKFWLTNLGQMIKIISPILQNIFIERFSVQMMCKAFHLTKAKLIDHCQPISYDHPLIKNSLFKKQLAFLKEKNYSFVSFEGLEEKICFDFQNKTFYLDSHFFLSQPISFFFHRLSLMIRAKEQQEFIFLHLDPMNETFPILQSIASAVSCDSTNELTKLLSDFEKDRLKQLGITQIKVQEICRLWTEVWDELYKEQLADSLDLVGLIESYLNLDLFDEENLLPLNLIHKNRRVRLLLNFATVLKF